MSTWSAFAVMADYETVTGSSQSASDASLASSHSTGSYVMESDSSLDAPRLQNRKIIKTHELMASSSEEDEDVPDHYRHMSLTPHPARSSGRMDRAQLRAMIVENRELLRREMNQRAERAAQEDAVAKATRAMERLRMRDAVSSSGEEEDEEPSAVVDGDRVKVRVSLAALRKMVARLESEGVSENEKVVLKIGQKHVIDSTEGMHEERARIHA